MFLLRPYWRIIGLWFEKKAQKKEERADFPHTWNHMFPIVVNGLDHVVLYTKDGTSIKYQILLDTNGGACFAFGHS